MNKPYFLLASSIISLLAANSFALDVSSPYVEKGVMEIESENRFDFDHRDSRDLIRKHEMGVGYGITSFWGVEIGGEFEKDTGKGYEYAATEIENTFQLTEIGEYWADIGLKASYEFVHSQGDADKLGASMLIARKTDKYTTMANIGFEKEVGSHSNQNPEGELSWMARYNYIPILNPGVEYYAEFGEISDMSSYSEQKHLLGPVIYGKLGHGVKYELGSLFGISKAASDVVVKFNLEYEFPWN